MVAPASGAPLSSPTTRPASMGPTSITNFTSADPDATSSNVRLPTKALFSFADTYAVYVPGGSTMRNEPFRATPLKEGVLLAAAPNGDGMPLGNRVTIAVATG